MTDLVELGHDNSGSILVAASRAGEAEPATRLVLGLLSSRDISQAQVGAGQGPQPLPGKVVDRHHNAPCGLHRHTDSLRNHKERESKYPETGYHRWLCDLSAGTIILLVACIDRWQTAVKCPMHKVSD